MLHVSCRAAGAIQSWAAPLLRPAVGLQWDCQPRPLVLFHQTVIIWIDLILISINHSGSANQCYVGHTPINPPGYYKSKWNSQPTQSFNFLKNNSSDEIIIFDSYYLHFNEGYDVTFWW